MASRAVPRIARMTGTRTYRDAETSYVCAEIIRGPMAELGKEVRVRVTAAGIPELRLLIEHLEAQEIMKTVNTERKEQQ